MTSAIVPGSDRAGRAVENEAFLSPARFASQLGDELVTAVVSDHARDDAGIAVQRERVKALREKLRGVDGAAARKRYRSFRIRGLDGLAQGDRQNDDFASMAEVLGRRVRRALAGGGGGEKDPSSEELEEGEEDMLDRAWGLEADSRLSCQAILGREDVTIDIPKYSINHAKENKA